MFVTRIICTTVVALAIIGTAHAQRVAGERQPIRGQLQGASSLVSAIGLEKLKLTAEQKEKFAKIETEFNDKTKSAQEEIRNIAKDAGRDREKLKEAYEKFQTATKKSREDALTKVAALLTADQKAVLTQVQQEPAVRRPDVGVRPIVPIAVGGAGQLIPPGVQARLQLTDDQKKQIEAIQKDAETKALKVLTEEQRKQYEEFKKNTGRGVLPVRPVQREIQNSRRVNPNPAPAPEVKKVR